MTRLEISNDVTWAGTVAQQSSVDGTRRQLLVEGSSGSVERCVLDAGATSIAIRHRTVEELWVVLDGRGQIWRSPLLDAARYDAIGPGDSLRIGPGTSVQFRANIDTDLVLLVARIPRWSGAHETEHVRGPWPGVGG